MRAVAPDVRGEDTRFAFAARSEHGCETIRGGRDYYVACAPCDMVIASFPYEFKFWRNIMLKGTWCTLSRKDSAFWRKGIGLAKHRAYAGGLIFESVDDRDLDRQDGGERRAFAEFGE